MAREKEAEPPIGCVFDRTWEPEIGITERVLPVRRCA